MMEKLDHSLEVIKVTIAHYKTNYEENIFSDLYIKKVK